MSQIPVGISQCLLGANVRFDGGHKHSRYCSQVLAKQFNFVSVCPEMAIGLGVPRPTIRLVNSGEGIRLVESKNPDVDHTDKMLAHAQRCHSLVERLSGFIFAKNSPSCGPRRVKVYHQNGNPLDSSSGIFAGAVMAMDPLLPVEDDGRLNDLPIRDSFITRVMIYHEWKHQLLPKLSKRRLYSFHARHKFTLLAYNQRVYRQLGPMLANITQESLSRDATRYITLLMSALSEPAQRKNHTNVLMHLQGFLKQHINADHRAELAGIIRQYHQGIQPLMAPITLLKHYMNHYKITYLQNQSYLQPYPDHLMARVMM